MRVTIEHREEAVGRQRDYFVDCTVELSEEEKAIVKARGLGKQYFEVPPATPPPTTGALVGVGAARSLGGLLIIVAVVWGIVSGLSGRGEGPTSLLFFIGIGLVIYGWRRGREQDKRIVQSDQTITIGKLLTEPRFTVHAIDPGQAKLVDEDIRGKLVAMKELIAGSAELGKKQTFEL